MQANEEKQEEIQETILPSLNDMISPNVEINPVQATYQHSTTAEVNHPDETTTKANLSNEIKEELGEEIPQETTEIKTAYKRDGQKNTRYEQTMDIKEEPYSTTKIVKRVIQTEHPITETNYYEKRVIKNTTTTTRGGDNSNNKNNNSRYSNSNINNIVRSSGTRSQISTNKGTYTRPTPSARGSNNYSNQSGRTPSTNRVEQNQYNNRYGAQNSHYSNNYSSQNRNTKGNPKTQKKVISSQSYIGNKYQPKRPESSSYYRQESLPDQNEIKRKTIYRGNPVKNVQITHIIYSSQPQDFHITENLNTESLQTEPIEISQADHVKLQKSGKTSWTTSVQDNIKPIVKNLKGKTTIFQHARGIGMTNERKENINPMFYSSDIKKLDPIIKEKEKEKVEYLTFRNSGSENNNMNNNPNTTRINYNGGNNYIQQKKSYAINSNNSIYNANRGSKVNNVRTNQNYTRDNYYTNGNEGEIVKETRTKVQMGSRSQFRNSRNPTSSVTTEKRVYNSNTFFNN